MTILNSKFDIIGRDPHPNAKAGLLVVLPVYPGNPAATWIDSEGSPVAGTIKAGTLVAMNSAGQAVLATSATALIGAFPSVMFTAIDGDVDFDGALVHKITCIQGGCEFQLSIADNLAGATSAGMTPGVALGVGSAGTSGQWKVAAQGEQIVGFVGQDGADTVKGVVNVIVPQGINPAKP